MLYDVVTGDKFEIAILTVIMCNMVLMTIQHHGQSQEFTDVLHILSYSYDNSGVVKPFVTLLYYNVVNAVHI